MKCVMGFFALISLLAKSQISENFESGIISSWYQFPSGRWELSSDDPPDAGYWLHHAYDNASSGDDRISYKHNLLCMDSAQTSWSFSIKYGYSPSSANNWNVFFAADNHAEEMHRDGNIQGYVVGVNFNGSDDLVKAWKIKNGDIEVLMNSGFNWENEIEEGQFVGFFIERGMEGDWIVSIDTSLLGGHHEIGTFNDKQFSSSMYFGIRYCYSSSQDRKLWFDNLEIKGHFFKDGHAPEINTVRIINERIIEVKFNETVDEISCKKITNYKINDENWDIDSIVLQTGNVITIHLGSDLESETRYQLSVSNISDVWGNMMMDETTPFMYYKIKPFDIVINEILFDPFTGGSEFIELYNRTEFVIDIKNFFIADINVDDKQIKSSYPVIQSEYKVFPEDYIVLTNDISGIETYYLIKDTTRFIKTERMPSLKNDEGQIALYDNFMNKLDEVYYSDDMHFALLNSTKGISLERIDPYVFSLNEYNWHSAATDAGFATPGYQNSQYNVIKGISEIDIEPEIFSPDNDGNNDYTVISYLFNEPGYVASIFIYDGEGRFVRSICNNELLGISGNFTWDGVNDNNELAKMGIYLVFIEYYNLKGIVNTEKRTCVLSPL